MSFDSAREEWPQYEWVNHFFAANGIEDWNKKKSAFLSSVGPTKFSGATSTVVVELSQTLFAQFGIPEVIVMDNVPAL